MSAAVAAASPLELAALWRLDLLMARDVVQACLNWLEQGLDEAAPDIAVLAAEVDPRLADVAPRFERILAALTGAPLSRDEALLVALRAHLAVVLVQPDERLVDAVNLVIARFANTSERRLVVHPARLHDIPNGVYAEQELGLEYVYGAYWQLDDLLKGDLVVADPVAVEIELMRDLREAVRTLHDHLLDMGAGQRRGGALTDLSHPARLKVRDEESLKERPGL